ncbi:FMN-dependent NADH-azoreductase [Polycyclovorans algicola]|uniref:FMN-dependent NADH-azoreductase n=1 Tax=Polycyclovorans algicola TaxID=616992 RepID=UPI0004A7092E|nr:NAD(P)H-dependent oxidoreductase [Polycyclovorans algicola]
MSTLLQINTSLFGGEGQSSKLTERFVNAWTARNPEAQVVVRDLTAQPLPHLDGARFQAFLAPAESRTAEQQAIVAESDALIDEVRSADVIVLGLPMYNFGVPSQLKAYFDHLARAGVSFRYTANGPEGLLGGAKVYILAARGGLYQGTPADTQTGYVTTFLNFIGLTDIEFVYAEGLAMGDEPKREALDRAAERIGQLAA